MKVIFFKTKATDSLVQSCSLAFAQGLKKSLANFSVLEDVDHNDIQCDIAAMWGMYSKKFHELTLPRKEIQENQRNRNQDYLVIERGFIKRDQYHSIGWNGHCGRANFCNRNMPSDRWNELGVKLQSWKTDGEKILLIGQIPHDTSVQHIDYIKWCEDTVVEIRKFTDREIVFRPHPLGRKYIEHLEGVTYSTSSLEDDFKSSRVCITFNSTTAVESIINGIPTVAMDPGSMAYDVCMHDLTNLENPQIFKRQQWAYNLAYTQWNIDEIKEGLFWNHLSKKDMLFKSDKYKFMFCHIPKTGGTSIKAALNSYTEQKQVQIEGEKVSDLHGYRPHMPFTPSLSASFPDYFKFVCVRNPWAWHASIWKFTQKRKMNGFYPMTFEEYISSVFRNENRYAMNQLQYFTAGDQLLVDFIVRFENLQEDFDHVCETLGIEKIELGHYKNAGKYSYRDLYNDKTRKMVEKHCLIDIQTLKYEF